MKLADYSRYLSIDLLAVLLLSAGCSSKSNEYTRGVSKWKLQSASDRALPPWIPEITKESTVATGSPESKMSSGRPTRLSAPKNDQANGVSSVGYVKENPKVEDPIPELPREPVGVIDSSIMPELQSTWGKLSPEELVEQLEKGLHKEQVKAILHSASVVEVVNPWGKVWVMGSDTPPVFFDVRGRLIDWGWFEYHNLVDDLDPAGDSLSPSIRIVKDPGFKEIMPLPQSETLY